MATKKTTKTKKTGGSKKQGHSYKTAYEQNQRNKRQISAIILFTVGILLGSILIIEGKSLWLFMRQVIYGLFGVPAFILPISFIYIAIMTTLDKPIGDLKHKVWQTGVLVGLVCSLVELSRVQPFAGKNFIGVIKSLYENATHYKGGGVFSAIFGWPLFAACDKLGAIIIISLLLFAFVMLLTGSTLIGLFHGVYKPVKKMEETYIQKREANELKKQNKFNINVDLGPEAVLPQHPVSSPKPTPEDLINLDKAQRQKEKAEKKIKASGEQLEELIKRAVTEPENAISPQVNSELPKEQQPEIEPILDKNDQTKLYTDNNNNVSQYVCPPISLLKAPKVTSNRDVSEELKSNAALLVDTLKSFGVQTRVIDISRGPTVTRYELQPSAGVKISKITGLADDIALNLAAAGVRIEAPIPNKAAVGIEVPNKKVDIVTMREIIESNEFDKAKSNLSMALGRDIAGNSVVADIAKMPHMLIAGATGSGKSVCINSIIISLLYKSSPSEVRFLMIDPKVVELGVYNGIPHLLVPVVTDPRKAAGALGWAVTEMLNRYKLFAENNVRDLVGYNELAKSNDTIDPLPQIVIIIDELADLMMAAPNEVEDSICRLAQMARAAGMHLVIATQRPSVDVITGVIKANIPSRIAFAVSSQVDSRTILDSGGAEKLLGRGDMLFYPVGMPKPLRVQGCFVSDKEVEQVVSFVKNKDTAEYDDKIIEEIEKQAVPEKGAPTDGGGFDDTDELLPNAIECVIEAGQASTSYLQRKLKVGYARAARIIDEMEEKGIIGPFEGSKPRQVLVSKQQWIEMKMNNED
ncbi:DNA translocase FtsK [Paludicola sp. MB14-C6]|uniref:FtsK/SpoIIIE family DNA translocase n=1 Tax=Paludihabitans sp. MB14-C6 TaxID=3070656 RepID=UPI0027DD1930|nr:DNA translocase FtsK [Paludicola sp. MB14-C6]WMJ23285.1 DNA translocase FtsK [Paludicola sp. MB14-C6]